VRVEVNIKVGLKMKVGIHVTNFIEGAAYHVLPSALGRTLERRLGYTAAYQNFRDILAIPQLLAVK
jgi:hypothetical protein